MARSKNELDYSVKRNDILDSAQKFILTIGYEQMSIQDIQSDLRISKGAFYHYFKSKADLLDALTTRLVETSMEMVTPIMQDTSFDALKKFQVLFDTIANWKTAQKEYLMQLLKVWYADENAVTRQKLLSFARKEISPLMDGIILQGINEGLFKPKRDLLYGEVFLSMMIALGDTIAYSLLDTSKVHPPGTMQRLVDSYTGVITDLLGAPEGSIILFDRHLLEEWTKYSNESPSYEHLTSLSTVLEE